MLCLISYAQKKRQNKQKHEKQHDINIIFCPAL